MIKKILFIIPPVSRILREYCINYCEFLPLGPLYIATVLENRGYKCRIFWPDYDYSSLYKKDVWQDIIKVIRDYSPDVLGLGFTTEQYSSAKKVAEIAKNVKKEMLIVAGGDHPTALPEETMREIPFIDIVIRGEGEYALIDIIESINNKNPLEKIKGITYIKDKDIISTPNKKPIHDLDNLPFPKRNLILNLGWKFSTLPQPIIGLRGCPSSCSICSKAVSGKGVRFRSPKNIVDEIEYLYKNYRIFYYWFFDSVFTVNDQRVMEICSLIKKRNLNIRWSCFARVDKISYRLVKMMKEVGCYQISLGLESGSKRILNYFNKGFELKDVKRALNIIKTIGGIRIIVAFLLGYPKETEETLNLTENLISKLPYDTGGINLLLPYPGTQIYKSLIRSKKLIINNWYDYQTFRDNILIKSDTQLQPEYLLERYYKMQNLINKKNRKIAFNKLSFKFREMSPLVNNFWFFSAGFKNLLLRYYRTIKIAYTNIINSFLFNGL